MQTIQQQRARYALEAVEKARRDGANEKEFKSYAAELPAMIHTNGLGQAAAFYRMKGAEHLRLYDILSAWLCRKPVGWITQHGIYHQHKDVLDGITSGDMHSYRLAQAEALSLMDWVKKFANAYMAESSQGTHQGP